MRISFLPQYDRLMVDRILLLNLQSVNIFKSLLWRMLLRKQNGTSKKTGQDALMRHYDNLRAVQPVIQSLAHIQVVLEYRLRSCVPDKDIPIVLGAILSNAPILLTLDQKHLLCNVKLAALYLPVSIITPGEFLRTYIRK